MHPGRPQKYKKEFCDQLISHMSQGLSYEAFAGQIGVTRDCLYKWEAKHQEFLYAKKEGMEKMLLFYEKVGIKAMVGQIPGFNASAWIFQMKNKCKWVDKVEQEISSNNSIVLNYKLDDSNQ